MNDVSSPLGLSDQYDEGEQHGFADGIQSTMNRKERRFFQKKDLQLHTTIRKGKATNQNMYILSPD